MVEKIGKKIFFGIKYFRNQEKGESNRFALIQTKNNFT